MNSELQKAGEETAQVALDPHGSTGIVVTASCEAEAAELGTSAVWRGSWTASDQTKFRRSSAILASIKNCKIALPDDIGTHPEPLQSGHIWGPMPVPLFSGRNFLPSYLGHAAHRSSDLMSTAMIRDPREFFVAERMPGHDRL